MQFHAPLLRIWCRVVGSNHVCWLFRPVQSPDLLTLRNGAAYGDRTRHLLLTRQACLPQHLCGMVGAVGVEPTFDPNQGPVFPLDDAPTDLFHVRILWQFEHTRSHFSISISTRRHVYVELTSFERFLTFSPRT